MSTIKVNKLEQRSGCTATVGGGAGKTVTVDATTVTLGRCGGTVSLASGATQSGFGRTGTVDWCTTAKTSPFTAVNGDGFFVNTTSGSITVTLPASPSAGDIVAFKDYANTWDCNAVIVCRNGSKIRGDCANATLSTEAQSVTLIYVDGTKGWLDIQDSTSNVGIPNFITATGGTITTCGNFKIHTFTSDGCFAITTAPTPANNNVSYLVVAGGAGGGANHGGGGGAGGFREGKDGADTYTASPIAAPAGLPVSASTTYPITIGAGGGNAGAGSPTVVGGTGSNSVFSTITSHGGGGGAGSGQQGVSGGSGGGDSGENPSGNAGSGNTPPVSPPQGNPGESRPPARGNSGGGGGAAEAGGTDGVTQGGDGASTSITGNSVTRGGGGGGSCYPEVPGYNGAAGAGGGGRGANGPTQVAEPGTANTGGGGGGVYCGPANSGTGGSGIVVIRYKFKN
jgi:hypothetical protein